MRLVLAVLATIALAGPAAALADPATYSGTLTGKGVGKANGLPRQKKKVTLPTTGLSLQSGAGRFDFSIGVNSLGGPMTAARKGAFKVLQPTGSDLTTLIAQTQTFFTENFSLPVTVTDVKVAGRHKPTADGSKERSNMVLRVTGTALGVLPFHARATLKYAGLTTM
jgi:hypothetical protein